MSLFSRLFGGSENSKPEADPTDYEGFAIFPEPVKEGSHYRVQARIEKEVAGELKSHTLIRADTLESHEAASEASVGKAKLMIDQQGEGLFG